MPIAAALDFLGFEIYATSGTAAVLKDSFVEVNEVNPLDGESPNIQELLESGEATSFRVNVSATCST